jgi:Ankyrin repeat
VLLASKKDGGQPCLPLVAQDGWGRTPLHWAAAAGAAPSAANRKSIGNCLFGGNKTRQLHQSDALRVVCALLRASPAHATSIRDHQGYTPLQLAAATDVQCSGATDNSNKNRAIVSLLEKNTPTNWCFYKPRQEFTICVAAAAATGPGNSTATFEIPEEITTERDYTDATYDHHHGGDGDDDEDDISSIGSCGVSKIVRTNYHSDQRLKNASATPTKRIAPTLKGLFKPQQQQQQQLYHF